MPIVPPNILEDVLAAVSNADGAAMTALITLTQRHPNLRATALIRALLLAHAALQDTFQPTPGTPSEAEVAFDATVALAASLDDAEAARTPPLALRLRDLSY